jgi:PKD repeat protein
LVRRLISRIFVFIILFQLAPFYISRDSVVKGAGTRTIRFLNYSDGLNYTTVGNTSETVPPGGIPFTLKVVLDGQTNNLSAWQVGVIFDNNSIRCTNILIPENDSSYVFYGTQEFSDVDFRNETQDGKYGAPTRVVAGASLFNPSQLVNVSNALLCLMTWTVLKTGNYSLSFLAGAFPPYTFLLDFLGYNIPVATADFSLNAISAVSKPVAVFTVSPQNPRANDTVTFDASKSYDPNREAITAFTWDFGDNTTATNVNSAITVHKYSNKGPYQVNLTVTAADGRTGSTVGQLQVGSIPTATFNYLVNGIRPSKILPNTDEVTFNASESVAPDGMIVTYQWDFGDNSTFTSIDSISSHRFLARGVYNVKLKVVDNNGLYNSKIISLQVGNPPTVSFTWTPTSPLVGEAVSFSALSTAELGTSIVEYEWDFGFEPWARKESSNSTMTHIYYSEGNWTLNLTVYDTDGLHTSSNETISVSFSAVRDMKTEKTLIGQGYTDAISVTLQTPDYYFVAQGSENVTIDLTLYANSSLIYSESILFEESNVTVALPLSFKWNTTGFAYGSYRLSAYAVVSKRLGHPMESNITCDVPVHVGVPGDINNDGIVNMRDVQNAVYMFNSFPGTVRWNPDADIDDNGRIDMRDINIVVINFNRHE